MKFIPILKTKYAEFEALPLIKDLRNIIPYIEVTKNIPPSYMNELRDLHQGFISIASNKENLVNSSLEIILNSNLIPILIMNNEKDIFHKKQYIDKLSCSYGIKTTTNNLDILYSLFKNLNNKPSYIFLDTNRNNIRSELDKIKLITSLFRNFSNFYLSYTDRQITTNEIFAKSPNTYLNLEPIKDFQTFDKLGINGIANYVSLKNELTSENIKNSKTTALLTLLSEKSLRPINYSTSSKEEIYKAYMHLLEVLKEKKEEIFLLFKNDQISTNYFKYLLKSKPFSSHFFTLQIIRYCSVINDYFNS